MVFESPIDLKEKGFMPGQFLHLRPSESYDLLLRRPLSLCMADVEHNVLTVVYRAQGEGTKRLARLAAGDVVDVLGPLGHGFAAVSGDRRSLLVGGGIGVPPLVELGRYLKKQGQSVISVLGFQNKSQAILLDEFAQIGDMIVMSDDGTIGERGLVTGALTEDVLMDVDRFYSCGPTPMLKAVQATMKVFCVPGFLSLEERMGCGIGICVGCVHEISQKGELKYVKTCKEGPVFPSEEVVFS